MTAIGIILFFGSMTVFWFDEHVNVPDLLQKIAGFIGFIGFVLFIIGLLTWIWKVMP